MNEEILYLGSGILLGLTAGLSPGPLLALVISETLKHGLREGIKVSLSPLITDLPIVLFTVWVLSRLADLKPVLGAVSVCGAVFLFYLGYESLTTRDIPQTMQELKPQSLQKGVITNFLNPHPYMFWFAVGAPMLLKASRVSTLSSVLFISGFYIFILGSKIVVAAVVERFRTFLSSRIYINLLRSLGVILLGFGVSFLWEGWKLFTFP